MNQKTIAVLFGGCSPEYGVSLASAYSVLCHMDMQKFKPFPVGITPDGDWFAFHGDFEKIFSDQWHNNVDCTPVAFSPSRTSPSLLLLCQDGIQSVSIDAAFPVLHGRNGEDGTIQGMFELAAIPLIGCGTVSSALCMDKDRAHKLVSAEGISVPQSFALNRSGGMDPARCAAERIGYPLFVKPVRAGSSFGISRITERESLAGAIRFAFQYDDTVLLEQAIEGFEVGCAVMGGETLTVGELDEVELSGGFFNYTEKYTLKTSALHVPARIPPQKSEQIKSTAKIIYRALGCSGFARVDVFYTPGGKIVFNEVNTIPGFTTHSRFPIMMNAAGISFEEVITRVIEQAVGV
ncbi:MAG: D-alanine--D-serine ligase VanG [Eubacteriales bacterium]|nr:D-alanine--D-serine ligase VanG [Eubacteriales bacterium]